MRFNTKGAGDREVYKSLRAPPGKLMTCVTTGDGQITADPEVVDERARMAWKDVYDGTGGEEDDIVSNFIDIYAGDSQRAAEARTWGTSPRRTWSMPSRRAATPLQAPTTGSPRN